MITRAESQRTGSSSATSRFSSCAERRCAGGAIGRGGGGGALLPGALAVGVGGGRSEEASSAYGGGEPSTPAPSRSTTPAPAAGTRHNVFKYRVRSAVRSLLRRAASVSGAETRSKAAGLLCDSREERRALEARHSWKVLRLEPWVHASEPVCVRVRCSLEPQL